MDNFYIVTDKVRAWTLEPGDLIMVDGEHVVVESVSDKGDVIFVDYRDSDGELTETQFMAQQVIDLYSRDYSEVDL